MTADRQQHWQQVYQAKAPDPVSCYQPWPGISLELITLANLRSDDAVIAVCAGTSTLVDALLDSGRPAVILLDFSSQALDLTRTRLKDTDRVQFVVGDVLTTDLPEAGYGLWHDRAVFHFLTDAAEQARYVQQAYQALKPGGALVVGTFALDGPARCSGLEARQYSAETLSAVFLPSFRLVDARQEEHHTPAGQVQRFTFVLLKRQS